MSVSNCGHDENWTYWNGQAGDQTGTEWEIKDWYNYSGGWTHVIRFENPKVASMIAQFAIAAAMNNCIGYDQNQRYTFWEQLKAVGYNPANIKVNCETDCSAGVAAICKAVGYVLGILAMQNISIYAYTGNIADILRAAGAVVFTDSKHLNSDKYAKRGDIYLKQYNHVMINVTDGYGTQDDEPTKPSVTTDKQVNAYYQVYTKEDGWLPIVKNLEDYAGIEGHAIRGLACKVTAGTIKYQVHVIGKGWYDWVTDFNLNDIEYGFAGDLVNPIDCIRVYYYTPDNIRPYKVAQYRVDTTDRHEYFSWQYDTDTSNGQDGYAGDYGRPIDRVQLVIS